MRSLLAFTLGIPLLACGDSAPIPAPGQAPPSTFSGGGIAAWKAAIRKVPLRVFGSLQLNSTRVRQCITTTKSANPRAITMEVKLAHQASSAFATTWSRRKHFGLPGTPRPFLGFRAARLNSHSLHDPAHNAPAHAYTAALQNPTHPLSPKRRKAQMQFVHAPRGGQIQRRKLWGFGASKRFLQTPKNSHCTLIRQPSLPPSPDSWMGPQFLARFNQSTSTKG
jgi:hypothetical protein